MTDLIFQARDGAPRRLIVLLHGVGSCAADIAPIARMLGDRVPDARLLVPDGFQPFDGGGSGRQWFSVTGVTPVNRSARVDAVLPDLLNWIEARRLEADVEADAVSLFGFSQGSIMALAASARGAAFGSVVAVAGRLVDPVIPATPDSPRLLLLHGLADPVIPAAEGADAARRLSDAGYTVEFRTEPGHGHGVSPTQVRAAAEWFGAGSNPA
jgi:phospholipase/carboxylesterase